MLIINSVGYLNCGKKNNSSAMLKMEVEKNICCDKANENCLQKLPPSLQNIVGEVIDLEGYINYDLEKNDFNTGGGNFLGLLYEIDIHGTTRDGEKETNVFLKQIVNVEKIKIVPIIDCYLKEAFVYNDLGKVFAKLQMEANVPREDWYKMPNTYGKSNGEAIVLENLSKKGFKTIDRFDVVTLKYAELVVKELAKFHGLSFVIKEKMPDYFDGKIKRLNHPYSYDGDWDGMIRNICSYVANLFDNEIKEKINNFLPISLKKFRKYNNDQTTIRCGLTHGDFRINNILVREEDGEPFEAIIIDYQAVDYGCQIRDFFYFIFASTDKEFRRKHLNYLKDLYFNTFSTFLNYFDINVEVIYPRKDFERVCVEWMDFGLMMVLFSSAFLFAPDTGLDVQNLSLSELPYSLDRKSEERIKGLVEDFVQWGYL